MNLIVTTPEELESIIANCFQRYGTPPPPPQPEPTEHLHSVKQLAEFLNCSIVTAHKLKKSGKIRYKQFGRKLIFSTSEVLEDLSKLKKR